MRRAAAPPLLAFLVAGCLGTPDEPADVPAAAPSPPTLEVLVTDEEWVPVPHATVFIDGDVQNHTTDIFGRAELPLPDGPFVVKAWAPSYYRNDASGEPNGNETNVHVFLEKRGDDVRYETTHIKEGLCYVGVGAPNPQNRCQSSPTCSVPFSSCPVPASLAIPLPEAFHNLTVRLKWEKEPDDQDLVFLVRLYPSAPFADGRDEIVLDTGSPIDFQLTVADVGPNVTFGDAWIQFMSAVSGDRDDWATVPVASEQPFLLEADVVQRYALPPAVPW